MGENTKIQWAHHTFNPWVGCQKISPACDHCYAETWAKRTGQSQLWNGQRRRTTPQNWRKPVQWNADAGERGIRYRVFCASLADVFDNDVPPGWRADLFALINTTPNLDWLLLTKRVGNVKSMLPIGGLPRNVWLGITVVTQEEADRDIMKMLGLGRDLPVRFLSLEPLLETIDLSSVLAIKYAFFGGNKHLINQVIVGGESGIGARPMDVAWARSLRDQCRASGAAFFMKQLGGQYDKRGELDNLPADLRIREFPNG